MIKLLYFARLRETLGVSGESLTLPAGVEDVRSLRAWLAARGGEWQAQFAGGGLLRAAVNQELAPDDAAIKSGDEVAFFPPDDGRMMEIRVQHEDFDAGLEINRLRRSRPDIGAVAAFVGQVRDMADSSPVLGMTLEHYPGMTERCLRQIVEQAQSRWRFFDAVVIHRIGALKPQEQIVLVLVAGAHRGEAFAACEFIMDYLKTRAPFWKKETTPQGERWVAARQSDEQALERW